eukprot:1157941-Pelagomonas_calceolata.AAC.3
MLRHCSRLAGILLHRQSSNTSCCCAANLSHKACKLMCASSSLASPSLTYHSLSRQQHHGGNSTHHELPSVWLQWGAGSNRRFSDIPGYNEEVEAINNLFVEARDEIEMAHEESGMTSKIWDPGMSWILTDP